MKDSKPVELKIASVLQVIEKQRAKLAQLEQMELSHLRNIEELIVVGTEDARNSESEELNRIRVEIGSAKQILDIAEQQLADARLELEQIRRANECAAWLETRKELDKDLERLRKMLGTGGIMDCLQAIKAKYLSPRDQSLAERYSQDAKIRNAKVEFFVDSLERNLRDPINQLEQLINSYREQ